MKEKCSANVAPIMPTGTFLSVTLTIQEQFTSTLQHDEEMMRLKTKLDEKVEFRYAIAENSAICFEQDVLGEINLEEFKVKQQKLRQASKEQKAIEFKIKEYEQVYSRFSRLCKIRDK